MKTLWLGILCVLLPRLALATPCNTNCTFIRGDANCSQSVNMDDYWAIYYGSITNYDAADVNDDGTINAADSYAILQYLSWGIQPACPFPYPGLDCTEDYFENCCSPPTNYDAPLLQRNCVADSIGTWDYNLENQYEDGDVCVGQGWFRNYDDASCTQPSTNGIMDLMIPVSDGPGFTRKRLQNGVQGASLHVLLVVEFDTGTVCDDDDCTHTNLMYVDPYYMDVKVLARKKGGGSYGTYIKSYWDNSEMDYTFFHAEFNDVCVVASNDSELQIWGTINPVHITSNLASMPTSDCDVWEIFQMEVNDIEAVFTRLGQDHVPDMEEIKIEATAWVEYEWCECP